MRKFCKKEKSSENLMKCNLSIFLYFLKFQRNQNSKDIISNRKIYFLWDELRIDGELRCNVDVERRVELL